MNTRPQQFGRTLKPSHRFDQRILKITKVSGNAVGQRAFQMIPNPLIRVQVRSVGRKSKSVNFRVLFKPLFGLSRSVGHTAVPEQNKTFPQMPLEMLQKFNHLKTTDVLFGMQPDVKINPFTLWRCADGRNRRNFAPASCHWQNWRLPSGRPRPLHARNQRKAALVKKHQRNFLSFGLFLYAASSVSSNSELPVRSSPEPLSQASDNSTPYRLANSRYIWGGTRLSGVALSLHRFLLSSIIPSHIRSLQHLPIKSSLTYSAAFHSAYCLDPQRLSLLTRLLRIADTVSSSRTPNSSNILTSWLLPARLILLSATRLLAGAVSQVASGFHVVSWNQLNMLLDKDLLL